MNGSEKEQKGGITSPKYVRKQISKWEMSRNSVTIGRTRGADLQRRALTDSTSGSAIVNPRVASGTSTSRKAGSSLDSWRERALAAEAKVHLLEGQIASLKAQLGELGYFIDEEEKADMEASGELAIDPRKLRRRMFKTKKKTKYGSIYEYSMEDATKVRWDTDGSLQGASLTRLIAYITHPSSHDLALVTAFFTTYRSFTTPRNLLEKLILRFAAPTLNPQEVEEQPVVRLRTCNALRHWMDKHEYDFDDAKLRRRLRGFVSAITERKIQEMLLKAMDKAVANLKTSKKKRRLNDSIKALKERQEDLTQQMLKVTEEDKGLSNARDTPFPPILGPKHICNVFLDWPAEELARQITLLEFDLFQRIQPKEFLNLSWSKSDNKEKAPCICAMIDRFNEMSRLIATSILQENEFSDRKSFLQKWIQVAEWCLKLNNFNSLMEIVSALQTPALSRLRRLWDALPSDSCERFGELLGVTATDNNFKILRERIAQSPPPKLPYLGTFLADLTFIEEGNPDYLDDAKIIINFAKRQLLSARISDVQIYQQQKYNLMVVPIVRTYLLTTPLLSEEECYQMSLIREPRDRTVAKASTAFKRRSSKMLDGKGLFDKL